jgi:hypothetical protein
MACSSTKGQGRRIAGTPPINDPRHTELWQPAPTARVSRGHLHRIRKATLRTGAHDVRSTRLGGTMRPRSAPTGSDRSGQTGRRYARRGQVPPGCRGGAPYLTLTEDLYPGSMEWCGFAPRDGAERRWGDDSAGLAGGCPSAGRSGRRSAPDDKTPLAGGTGRRRSCLGEIRPR